jgi:hypothetical protein
MLHGGKLLRLNLLANFLVEQLTNYARQRTREVETHDIAVRSVAGCRRRKKVDRHPLTN